MNLLPPPCVLFEDDHLLVVNKPAGVNTHAPAPYAGEGIYDWLRHREPRWASLAIIHRLDKETSGVLVFAKTPLANRSLTEQFSQRTAQKRYLLRSAARPRQARFAMVSYLYRAGERYFSRATGKPEERAETQFEIVADDAEGVLIAAHPLTGRTHQIRVHAAAGDFPILGDTLYGGAAAPRMHLHAEQLVLKHPATGAELTFTAAARFAEDPRQALRQAFVHPEETDAFRMQQGAADGVPGCYGDRLAAHCLLQAEAMPPESALAPLRPHCAGLYFKALNRRVRATQPENASPHLIWGQPAPERFLIRENGVQYELSFQEGYSVGLFLDQRDNRRRFLTGHVAAGFPLYADPGRGPREVLNTFAYTCGFSVCAALGGARATSLDLSKKYLDWGRRNFALNHLDPAAHDFIYGDAINWMKRLARKQRFFDVIVLDPPTFSQSREHGIFRVEKDFGQLVTAALALLPREGVLLASTNAATLNPEDFLHMIDLAVRQAGRRVSQTHYVPQPPDFPITRTEPAYLKTAWLRIS